MSNLIYIKEDTHNHIPKKVMSKREVVSKSLSTVKSIENKLGRFNSYKASKVYVKVLNYIDDGDIQSAIKELAKLSANRRVVRNISSIINQANTILATNGYDDIDIFTYDCKLMFKCAISFFIWDKVYTKEEADKELVDILNTPRDEAGVLFNTMGSVAVAAGYISIMLVSIILANGVIAVLTMAYVIIRLCLFLYEGRMSNMNNGYLEPNGEDMDEFE